MMFLCMYVAFDISKRSLSVYVATLPGPHLQTVIFPRAESLDMEELNMMVSGLVLHRTKGSWDHGGTRATEAHQAIGGDPPHPAEAK